MITDLRRLWPYVRRRLSQVPRSLRPYVDRRLWRVPRRLRAEQRALCVAFLRSELARVDAWRWASDLDIWDELSLRAERGATDTALGHFDPATGRGVGRPALRRLLTNAEQLRGMAYAYAADGDEATAYLFNQEALCLVELVDALLASLSGSRAPAVTSG